MAKNHSAYIVLRVKMLREHVGVCELAKYEQQRSITILRVEFINAFVDFSRKLRFVSEVTSVNIIGIKINLIEL